MSDPSLSVPPRSVPSLLLKTSGGLPPVRLDPLGRRSLASYAGFSPTADQLAMVGNAGRLPTPADVGLPPLATSMVPVASNASRFQHIEAPILARSFGRPIEKLSWCPRRGELLFVHPPQQHSTARGSCPFDDYVRLIVLHELDLVCARPCIPTWASSQGGHHVDAVALRRSTVLQLQAWRVVIQPHNQDKRWHFELNIHNARLRALTGRGGW